MSNLEKETCDKIEAVARNLFYEFGYKNTTIRKIAKEAEISVGLANYYFGSKDGLCAKIYSSFRKELLEIIKRRFPAGEDYDLEASHVIIFDAMLLMESQPLLDLYNGICYTEEMAQYMYEMSAHILRNVNIDAGYRYLFSITIPAQKPKLVNVDREKHNVTKRDIVRFFLNSYSLQFFEDKGRLDELVDITLQHYKECGIHLEPEYKIVYR